MRSLIFTAVIAIVLGAMVSAYKVGQGIYDMTGPAVEINFMGYAAPAQRGTGIHLRLRARTFVITDDSKTIAFVNCDGGMASDMVKMRVLEKLSLQLGEGVITADNLSISGTHTHSGPGGFLQYVLYQVTSLGFVQETFDAWVMGITNSIIMAYKNQRAAKIFVNRGQLFDANINRSPTSYLLNPEDERAQYASDGDTDKNMLLLKFVEESTGKPIGVLNWFAVHGTSMNNTNTLVSGDNKGYAAYTLEKEMNGPDVLPGMGPFVAIFGSTNLGDVSPNTRGAKCIDTGLPCDGTTSTCNGKCENCIAFGPGTNGDHFESTQIIGDKQYQHAKALMDSATEEVTGSIDFRHSLVDFSELNVTLTSGEVTQLCTPAMGYAFAAGTTDGPGMFNFTQGTTTGNPFWDKVRDVLAEPTKEEIACQSPKPILLNTADIGIPHDWDPRVLPLQIFRVGNVFIVSVPSELTTMAGRRMRAAVKEVIRSSNLVPSDQEIYVTIAGLANSYSSYVTTYEEYQAQRYEAASTIFGPHTLEGYLQEYRRLASDLATGKPSESVGVLPDFYDQMFGFMPSVKLDRVPQNISFGDIYEDNDAKPSYTTGEKVKVVFHAANPRNNQRLQDTFMTVEKKRTSGAIVRFDTVATDGDWSTKFEWRAGLDDPIGAGLAARSIATLTWEIPAGTPEGEYRMCYFGDHKIVTVSKPVPFSGCSSVFTVSSAIKQ